MTNMDEIHVKKGSTLICANWQTKNSMKVHASLWESWCFWKWMGSKLHRYVMDIQWFSDTILYLYKWVRLSVHLFVCPWVHSICWKKAEIKGMEGRSEHKLKKIRNNDRKVDQRTKEQNGGRIVGLLALLLKFEKKGRDLLNLTSQRKKLSRFPFF